MANARVDIEALRALETEATPSPWAANVGFGSLGNGERKVYATGPVYPCRGLNAEAEADAQLIAAMRNALPGLLTELERLRKVEAAADALAASVDLDTSTTWDNVDARLADFKAAKSGGGSDG